MRRADGQQHELLYLMPPRNAPRNCCPGTPLPCGVLIRYNAELAAFKARRWVFPRQR